MIDNAKLECFGALIKSGLVHKDFEISASSDGCLRCTFIVNPHLRSGNADIEP